MNGLEESTDRLDMISLSREQIKLWLETYSQSLSAALPMPEKRKSLVDANPYSQSVMRNHVCVRHGLILSMHGRASRA